MSKELNYFKQFETVDVTEHLEKKGRFTYLSWPFAVRELRRACPTASWEIHLFKDRDGMEQPYMATDCGFFIKCSVTVEGQTMTQIHPVLNNYNKPIESPTSFDINTSIQRCLVKAIALHGLGLHIYAGEDLPPSNIKKEGRSSVAGNSKPSNSDTLQSQNAKAQSQSHSSDRLNLTKSEWMEYKKNKSPKDKLTTKEMNEAIFHAEGK